MNTSAPYRARAANQGDVALCGYNHKRAAEIVDNWHNSTSPTPLAQPNPIYIPGHVPSAPPCDCGETNANDGQPGTDWQAFPGTWQGSPQELLTLQTYVKGAKIDLGQCHKYGFKSVAARKYWHGRYGFVDADGCGAPDRTASPATTKYRTIRREFTASVAGSGGWIDFNRVDRCSSATFTAVAEITGYDWTLNKKATFTVDAATGVVTQTNLVKNSACSGSWSIRGGFVAEGFEPTVDYDETISGTTFDQATGAATDPINNFQVTRQICPPDGDMKIIGFSIPDAAMLFANVGASLSQQVLAAMDCHCSTLDGSYFVATDWAEFLAQIELLQSGVIGYTAVNWTVISQEFSNTKMHVKYGVTFSEPAPTSGTGYYGSNTTVFELLIELSDPYTASEVQADIEDNLLSTWPLNDDKIYPWRKDEWTNISPLVIRREVQSNVNPDKKDFTPYTDPNDGIGYDGEIIGKPLTAGYWGAFDFYFDDERFCATDPVCIDAGSPAFGQYRYQSGGTLADVEAHFCGGNGGTINTLQYSTFLPATATHWTNTAEACLTPRGALIDMGTTTLANGGICAVKWAEARCRPYQSHNYARPCGFDRVSIDENNARCVSSVAGSDYTLDSALPVTGTETILVAFAADAAKNGIYTPANYSQAGAVLTLGTRDFPLPTGYTHDFSDIFTTNGGLVGIVRWPTAPALCGRVAVTIADAGSSHTQITFAVDQPNLRAGDALDFSKADMTATQSNVAVLTRTSDTAFIVDKAFADMTDTAWATSYGTDRKYFWNDASFKGDYRYGGWTVDNRASTETFGGCQAGAAIFDICNPAVVCFSPNGETWANGTTRWFGASGLPAFVADGVYGARVQANVEFVIQDLLWQAPKSPCPKEYTDDTGTHTATWARAMDVGGCNGDIIALPASTLFYPPYPLIEARCDSSVLAGPSRDQSPPAFATGIAWPTMGRPQPMLSDALGSIGRGVGTFHIPLEPWTRYFNERATINANPTCRFARDYEANYPMV